MIYIKYNKKFEYLNITIKDLDNTVVQMDITYYLQNNSKTKFKTDNLPLKNLMNYINKFARDVKINLLEFTFMVNFIGSKGNIVNINWFIDIVNKLGDQPFIEMCYKAFGKLFRINQSKCLYFDSESITHELISRKDIIEFTNDQSNAINQIIQFTSDRNSKTFCVYGHPGTGKTTVIVELVNFLIMKGYIKSIAFTAPTNKAVNIMKSKMRSNIKTLFEGITGKKYNNEFNLENIVDDINNLGIKIDFLTIHRLLNYKNDFDTEGDRIFVRNGNSSINNYEIIIIDECSMIPIQIVTHLFEDIRNYNNNIGDNYKKVPKIIFSGDPCQLPSVSERVSSVFIKSKEQLSYDFFSKTILATEQNAKFKIKNSGFIQRYNDLTNDILNMKSVILKEVVRNKICNVVNLCFHIREWIENIIKTPNINQYKGEGVFLYQYGDRKKVETSWFNKFIELQSNNINNNISNIILTWTNKQTDEYNTAIRNIMFKNKKNIDKFEIGDILMLNDFYNFDETIVRGKDMKNRFYTSEQIKVTDKDVQIKECGDFIEHISKTMIKMKNSEAIIGKYKGLIKSLNSKTNRKYTVWKLTVQKMSEALIKDVIPDLYTIYVTHSQSDTTINIDKETSLNMIKKFRNITVSQYSDLGTRIDREIIRPLWRQWNKIFIDPFAKVNYGNSHSVHKSQGSSFYNVFIDSDDILNNKNIDEAKRCIYTALTRSSNEIHILLP